MRSNEVFSSLYITFFETKLEQPFYIFLNFNFFKKGKKFLKYDSSIDESSFGPRLENVSFHELRRDENEIPIFARFFYRSSVNEVSHFEFTKIKNREIHEHKKRELTKTINCCGTRKQCRDGFE